MVEYEITIDPSFHCKDVTLDPSLWDEYDDDRYDIKTYNTSNTTNATVVTPTHRLLYPMRMSTFARQDPRELPMKFMTATNPVRIVNNIITVFGGGGGGGASGGPVSKNPYIKSFGLMKTFYAMMVIHLICWVMYMMISVMKKCKVSHDSIEYMKILIDLVNALTYLPGIIYCIYISKLDKNFLDFNT